MPVEAVEGDSEAKAYKAAGSPRSRIGCIYVSVCVYVCMVIFGTLV